MITNQNKGLWQYESLLPAVKHENQITLGEGNTNLIKKHGVYFKCEFENPTGSIKDRSIAYQISHLKEIGMKKAVISSSGNAAIAAAAYCKKAAIQLSVFVSPNININKLAVLKTFSCEINSTLKPISDAYKYAEKNKMYNLRQSKDLWAVYGYETIAFEIDRDTKEIDAMFIPVSSGTSFIGIAQGFGKLDRIPALHVVQTERNHPIAAIYDSDFTNRNSSLADGIVARITSREKEIHEWVTQSKGSGWVISDAQMRIAHAKLNEYGLSCSYEGAAAYAALLKSKKNGYDFKNPVCILTGKYYA
jgi:threonine synthase